MKYTIHINQTLVKDFDLSWEEASIIDILYSAWTRANSIVEDWEVYYYLSTGKVMDEVVLIKSRPSVNRFLSNLKDKCLIRWKFVDNKSYYRLSDTSIKYFEEVSQKWEAGVSNLRDNNITNYNINNKGFEDFLKEDSNKKLASYILLETLVSLWYKRWKTDTIDKFRDWTKEILTLNWIKEIEEFRTIVTQFKLYWETRPGKIKNYKATFMNSPNLPSNKKKYDEKFSKTKSTTK